MNKLLLFGIVLIGVLLIAGCCGFTSNKSSGPILPPSQNTNLILNTPTDYFNYIKSNQKSYGSSIDVPCPNYGEYTELYIVNYTTGLGGYQYIPTQSFASFDTAPNHPISLTCGMGDRNGENVNYLYCSQEHGIYASYPGFKQIISSAGEIMGTVNVRPELFVFDISNKTLVPMAGPPPAIVSTFNSNTKWSWYKVENIQLISGTCSGYNN